MFEIPVKEIGIATTLGRIARGFSDMSALGRMVAGTLQTETDRNFAAQGRPAWLGLAPLTKKRRAKAGTWPGRILQVSGQLTNSIATDYGRDYARIGSNKAYAAIQQLGGQAGRGKKVKIDPRPYLPADASGNLQPEARTAVLSDANAYLRSLTQ